MGAVCLATDPRFRTDGFIPPGVSWKDVSWQSLELFHPKSHPFLGQPAPHDWSMLPPPKSEQLWKAIPASVLPVGPLRPWLRLHYSAAAFPSLPNPASFPFLPFPRFWSLECLLTKLLHTNFHLRVCFLGNQPAISGFPFSLPYTCYCFLAIGISQWRTY